MESIIEKNHPPWLFTFISKSSLINIKVQKNNSKDKTYENSFTFKKLKKSKVFSNKKNLIDIIKGIIYFIEQNKITYEEKEETLKIILTSYNKRVLELSLNKLQIIRNVNNLNLILVQKIEAHNHRVSCVSIFPSGNIISVSCDKTIKIWDKINYNNIQCIEDAHDDYINYISVKDDNNFATCSRDKSIKTWIKKEKDDKYVLNHEIKNAHDSWIFKILFMPNEKIISCSYDKTVKIWENKNNMYANIKTMNHLNIVYSLLILQDKNMLISSGEFGTKIYSLDNYDCIYEFNDVKCWNWNSLCRINKNIIFVGGTHGIIKIISLEDKKVIKEINNGFNCWGIGVLDNLGIIITVGEGNNIKVYKKDNYEYIKDINDIHNDDIEGIINLNDDRILTYSWDNSIKIFVVK